MSTSAARIAVVSGVSVAGKRTVGRLLADRLGVRVAEVDDVYPYGFPRPVRPPELILSSAGARTGHVMPATPVDSRSTALRGAGLVVGAALAPMDIVDQTQAQAAMARIEEIEEGVLG